MAVGRYPSSLERSGLAAMRLPGAAPHTYASSRQTHARMPPAPVHMAGDAGTTVTQPVLAVCGMLSKRIRAVYDDDAPVILHTANNRKMPLRLCTSWSLLIVWANPPLARGLNICLSGKSRNHRATEPGTDHKTTRRCCLLRSAGCSRQRRTPEVTGDRAYG